MKLLFSAVAIIMTAVISLLLRFRLKSDKTVRRWKRSKKSFLILSAHPSEIDALPALRAIFPRFGRIVAGEQQLHRGPRGALFRKIGCIGKRQFCPDVSAVRAMFSTVRAGQVLAMMPEGRVSMDGTPSPIDLPTAKLIKKLGVAVAVLIPEGSYFIKPPYDNRSVILGPLSATLKPVFTEEDVKNLSVEELHARLVEAIAYDESETARARNRHYGRLKREPKKNISHLFYRCPACGELYSMSDAGRTLSCSACGTRWKLDSTSVLKPEPESVPAGILPESLPDTITAWNRTQRAYEREVWQDENLTFIEPVEKEVYDPESDAYVLRGSGMLRVDRTGVRFTDDTEEIFLPAAAISGFSTDYLRGDFVLYRSDSFTRLRFDDPRKVSRFMNSAEAIKQLSLQ